MTRSVCTWAGTAIVGAVLAPAIAGFGSTQRPSQTPERRLVPNDPAAQVRHLLLTEDSLIVTTSGNSVLEYSLKADKLATPVKRVLPSPDPGAAFAAGTSANGNSAGQLRHLNSGSLNDGASAWASASARTASGLLSVQMGLFPGRIVYFPAGAANEGSSFAAPKNGLVTVQASKSLDSAVAVSASGELLLLGADGSTKKKLNASWVPKSVSTEVHDNQPVRFASCTQTKDGWACLLNRPNADGKGESLLGVEVDSDFAQAKGTVLASASEYFTAGHVNELGSWCAVKVESGASRVLQSKSFGPSSKVKFTSPQFIAAVRGLKSGSELLAGTFRTSIDGKLAPSAQVLKIDSQGASTTLDSFDVDIAALDLNESSGQYAAATYKGDLAVSSLEKKDRILDRAAATWAVTRLAIQQGDEGLVIHFSKNLESLSSTSGVKAEGSFDLGRMRLGPGGQELTLQKKEEDFIKSVRVEPDPADPRMASLALRLSSGDFKRAYPTPDGVVPTNEKIGWSKDIYYIDNGAEVVFYRVGKDGAPREIGVVFSPMNQPVACTVYTDAFDRDWAAVSFVDQSLALYQLRRDLSSEAGLGSLEAKTILWIGGAGNWFAVEPKSGKFSGTPEAIRSFGYCVFDEATGAVRFVSADQLQETYLDASYVSQVAQGKSQGRSLPVPAAEAAAQAGTVDIIEVTGVKENFEDNMRVFETPALEAKLLLRASDGLKADAIRLSNGISAKSRDRGLEIREVGGDNEYELTVKLFPGDNPIRAYASGASADSTGDEILIRCTAPPTRDSNVWNVLVIAIPQYSPGSGYGDLLAVENDGKSVREAFESVKDKDATFKVTQIDPKKTTKPEVEAQIDAFVQSVRPGENLLIYASAHGDREGEDFYLITKSTQSKDLKGTAISWAAISQKISALNTRNALIVLDACHSGEAIDDQRAFLEASKSSKDAVAIWASSSPAEKSWVLGEDELKAAKSRAGSPAPGMSVFTLALVEGLRGDLFEQFYKSEWDGVVDLNRLYHLVGLRVADALEKSKGRGRMQQTPMIWGPRADVRLLNRKGAP